MERLAGANVEAARSLMNSDAEVEDEVAEAECRPA
jgi:hypothetical protein